ncbi:MAG: cytochrome c [Deltaproteobacteria bacterium]|nr:cytochrome c [Deltaproteobacteria bacterium]
MGIVAGCDSDPKQPGYEFFPDMVRSVPYDAFAPNPNFKDGKTLQRPPVGTVPRGFLPYPYGTAPEDAVKAGEELKNPVPFSPEALARGEKVYQNFCLICHGTTGQGDGPLIPKYPNPPSLTGKTLMQYPDGRLYHIVTMGSGEMASYASQIRPEDRWKLVFYLRKLQGLEPGAESRPATESAPATVPKAPAETLPSEGKLP